MNCPYCNRAINAFTGLQEAVKFQRHLGKCRKNPENVPTSLSNGHRVQSYPTLADALRIRSDSGQ